MSKIQPLNLGACRFVGWMKSDSQTQLPRVSVQAAVVARVAHRAMVWCGGEGKKGGWFVESGIFEGLACAGLMNVWETQTEEGCTEAVRCGYEVLRDLDFCGVPGNEKNRKGIAA